MVYLKHKERLYSILFGMQGPTYGVLCVGSDMLSYLKKNGPLDTEFRNKDNLKEYKGILWAPRKIVGLGGYNKNYRNVVLDTSLKETEVLILLEDGGRLRIKDL